MTGPVPEEPHDGTLSVQVTGVTALRFGPDDPVRAASAVARLGAGWLVVQDDATHAAWWSPEHGGVERVRLLPPVEGHDTFDEASATKHLKPDLEAACEVTIEGGRGVLLLGSGSLPPRTRGVVVELGSDGPVATSADLAPLYRRVRQALQIEPAALNLEGACVVGERLRWYQRGHARSGVPSASVDVELGALIAAVRGARDPADVELGDVRAYDLGGVGGLAFGITDAVALPTGAICVSATAEDAPDPVADGPVAGSVLALLDEQRTTVAAVPEPYATCKIEGLAPERWDARGVRLLAVVDDDRPATASLVLSLVLRGGALQDV